MAKSSLIERLSALEHKADPFQPVPICIVDVDDAERERIIEQFNNGELRALPLFIVDAS